MNKNKKENEIDAYTEALLNRKNNGDRKMEKSTPDPVDNIDTNDAEQQLKKALDQLRIDRGQQPIGNEERQYRDQQEPAEDFTTASLAFGTDQSLDYLHNAMGGKKESAATEPKRHAIPEIPNTLEKTATKLIKKGKHMKRKAEQKISEVDRSFNMDTLHLDFTKDLEYTTTQPIHIESAHKLDVKTAKKHRFKLRLLFILVLLVLLAGLMVGYAYKTTIYDPQHTITAKMENTYKKLVEYADEWDMSSETEKSELLDYQNKYEKLLTSQKSDINAYFKEQTGKPLTTVFKDLKNNKVKNEETKYAEIATYLSAWSTYDETQKEMIFDYLEDYANLTKAHQKKLDEQAYQLAQMKFKALCESYRPTELKTDAEKVEDYKAELKAAQQELEKYETYGEQLSEYAGDPETYGFTSEGIQQEIKSNESSIKQINSKISGLKKKIKELS